MYTDLFFLSSFFFSMSKCKGKQPVHLCWLRLVSTLSPQGTAVVKSKKYAGVYWNSAVQNKHTCSPQSSNGPQRHYFYTTDVLGWFSSVTSFSSGPQTKSWLPRVFWANRKYIRWPIATKETEINTSKPKASGFGAKMTMMKCRRSRR